VPFDCIFAIFVVPSNVNTVSCKDYFLEYLDHNDLSFAYTLQGGNDESTMMGEFVLAD
jgi:hypothetical protein